MAKKQKQFGKLPALYDFFLNPYDEYRFTRCPKCDQKTGQKKLPLLIWVDPHYPVSLNYTCRYCSTCDLLIAHQNEIEGNLTRLFEKQAPEVIGNDYIILGTMEKQTWKEGLRKPLNASTIPDFVRDFKQVLKFEVRTAGWYPDEKEPDNKYLPGKPKDNQNNRVKENQKTINNLPKTQALLEKINKAIPIPASPTKDLIYVLRKQGVQLDRYYYDVQIKKAFYMGDEGGIMCDITPAGKEKTPVLCSITQLRISANHPLFSEIQTYQEDRKRKLAGNAGIAGVTITPRKGK